MTSMVHVVTVPQTAAHFLAPVLAELPDWNHHIVTGDEGWLPARRLPEGLGRNVNVHVVGLVRHFAVLTDLATLLALVRLLRRLRPTVVHCHTPKAALLGLLAARATRVPCRLYTVRGLPLQSERGLHRVALWLAEAIALNSMTTGWAVSHSLHAALRELRVPGAGRLRVLGMGSGQGVDMERFTADPYRRSATRRRLGLTGTVTLGFVGRLVEDKGLIELVTLWTSLSDNPELRLLIVGGQDESRGRTVPEVERLRADGRVLLTGRVPDPEALLDAMDVFVFPSHREGFSNALLEAAAMGLPAVGFAVTGVVDGIIDQETGFVVPPGDTAGLIEATRRLVEDIDLRRKLGDNAVSWARRHFDRAAVVARTAEAVRTEVDHHRSPR